MEPVLLTYKSRRVWAQVIPQHGGLVCMAKLPGVLGRSMLIPLVPLLSLHVQCSLSAHY